MDEDSPHGRMLTYATIKDLLALLRQIAADDQAQVSVYARSAYFTVCMCVGRVQHR